MPAKQGLPYPVEELVGGGLYADVYRATGPKGTVALKVARGRSRQEESQQTMAWCTEALRFDTGATATPALTAADMNDLVAGEAEQLGRLKHPAFVRLIDSGQTWHEGQERRYLATEWVSGRTWRELLDACERIPIQAVQKVLAALVAADESGQVHHGDLKPENLLFDGEGNVRIIDPSAGATRFDDVGVLKRILLTDWYNPLLVPSDIPALGVLLMEVTTGAQPLLVASETVGEHPIGEGLDQWLRAAVAIGRGRKLGLFPRLPFPSDLNQEIAAPLEAVMLRCLRLQRQGRGLEIAEPYGSLRELAEALAPLV